MIDIQEALEANIKSLRKQLKTTDDEQMKVVLSLMILSQEDKLVSID